MGHIKNEKAQHNVVNQLILQLKTKNKKASLRCLKDKKINLATNIEKKSENKQNIHD